MAINVKAAADALPEENKLDLDFSISFSLNVDSISRP